MTVQTRIADLVANPGVLSNVVAKTYRTNNTLTASGIATTGPEVDLLMNGGSQLQGLNFVNKVDTTNYNQSSDDYDEKGPVGKITASPYMALRQDLNWGWAYTDLVRIITKYDVRGGLMSAIPLFWNEVGENIAIASLRGAIGSDAALTINNSTVPLDLNMLVDAGTGFDGDLKNIVVNPKGKAKLQKLNINAYVPAKQTDLNVDNFAGYNVFVSKALADNEMIVAADGALAFSSGLVPGTIGMEIGRDLNAGNGGGGEILRTRNSVVVAPQGMGYKGSVKPNIGSDSAAGTYGASLANPANWARVANLTDIAFRMVKFKA